MNFTRFRAWQAASLFILFFATSFWFACFRVENEIGPIGADKIGRQVMVASWRNHLRNNLKQDVSVDTGEQETSVIHRLVVEEPVAKKFIVRYGATVHREELPDFKAELNTDLSEVISRYHSEITMRNDWSVSPQKLQGWLKNDEHATSLAHIFACFGFERFEVYHQDVLVENFDLKDMSKGTGCSRRNLKGGADWQEARQ